MSCKTYVERRTAGLINYGIKSLLLLLFLQSSICASAQSQSPKFIRLTTNEGLSQGHVNGILKDKKGFMWFATDGGLNKYDGYKFTAYEHDPEEPGSISNNIVLDIMEDHEGNLWVGTYTGLDKFDRNKNKFVHYQLGNGNVIDIFEDSKNRIWAGTANGLYVFDALKGSFQGYKHNAKNANSLSNDYVYEITEDNNGELWIATTNGLNRFNPSLQRFFCYRNNPRNSSSISSDWVRTVFKDSRGNIWAGTLKSGISLYDRKKNSFVNYRHNRQNSNSISHDDILSLCEDDKGNLWIGTENGGICVYNHLANTFTNYKNDPYNAHSLSNNSIYSLYKDNLQTIWVGTYTEGVNFLTKTGDKFIHYNQNLSNLNSLSDHTVLTITGNNDGNIWIGTDGGGLNRFNTKTQTYTHYLNDVNNKNSINSNYAISVVEVDENLLGLGLYQGGFDLFNTKTGKFSHHVPEKDNTHSLSSSSVSISVKSRDGNIWIGTWGGGINLYDRKKNNFNRYVHNPNDTNSISSHFINCMMEDKEGNLWIGSVEGLDKFNKVTNTFTHYRHSDKNKKSLSHNYVDAIFEDKANNLWIGTGGGLNLFDRKNGTFTAYTEKDGLANNMIHSILEDLQGNLWLGSSDGLTKFYPATKIFRNYNMSDGLQGKEFKASSCFRAADGQLFFGGTNGFNAFYPDSLKDNKLIPPVYITDFEIFNKQVLPGDKNAPIQQQISEAKEITLSYKQSVFSFEFAALNYTLPEKNQYAYKLEGFDKAWIYSGNKRAATYTNLDPGKYIFHVKGSNNDGLWNEKGTSVTINIMPPFWMTWWFKIAILLLIIGSAAAFFYFRVNAIKSQKRILEQKVQQQTAQLHMSTSQLLTSTAQLLASNEEERKARQEADQANRAKSVFLATMSHEIRTPMNGVMGMASLLMQTELTGEQKSYAKTISTCGESLLSVINGILDFSKIESGKMELENKLFALQTCIEEALDIFSFKASETGIKLAYHIDADVPNQITGDSLRLRQVLINLVGNAIKFTPRGEISVGVRLLKSSGDAPLQIGFEVRDTGIGIAADKIERLFKAFSQVDSSTTRQHGGTGLGLVICDKLIALMGGSIKVASEEGKGTTFTFSIETTFEDEPVPDDANNPLLDKRNNRFKVSPAEEQKLTTDFAKQHPLSILIAEDNPINALIVNTILNKLGYKTATAENGLEALNMLSCKEYDLIFMDVQMPEMDGLEATRNIRQMHRAQPVIVAMTANAMQGDREACLEAGMDDYMSKPIKLQELSGMLKKWALTVQA